MSSKTIPDGWDTAQQIRDHQLATSIINGHRNGVNDVFDPESLEIAREMVRIVQYWGEIDQKKRNPEAHNKSNDC
jgi:hypothetical protein